MNVVKVGMADLNVARSPDKIRTIGLGSCVGITLYDHVAKIGGMAHIMLPSASLVKEGLNPAKFADTAIPVLIDRLVRMGVDRRRLIAKIAGGAQMFPFAGASDIMRIGPRNVEACKQALKNAGIPLHAEDTGGNWGRTLEMDCMTGKLEVKSFNRGVKLI
ncbi:chemotaxis protein CheD [Ammoniphilus oxalaticus]|uniref:Probable chemoreceptor glutamine deamidase CheD n=1 Tax=Ammoniphilus oxalaticus TaxID=66863 RepID=A0A419SJV0_9BACL|nr:chemotaxis protein CheD [Ammoniphilus oxalaticus]RKD24257.1 chemotaxis protein CheD [Ammoniphilus oxalaticus]